MNIRFLCLFFAFACFNSIAQNYFAIRNDGDIHKGYFLDQVYDEGTQRLLTFPSNDLFSPTVNIPFPFQFYGTQYQQLKVSDNGFLTFNLSSNQTTYNPQSIPSNSIFAFYNDFKLAQFPNPNQGLGVKVYAYTFGEAPKRQFVIQYFGLSRFNDSFKTPTNNASVYAFAIVLHEGNQGRFDIIYSPYGDKNLKGFVGCKSASGTTYLVNDSAIQLPHQFSFNTSQFIVYQFNVGRQLQEDVQILDVNVNKIYPTNAIVNFSGRLKNNGKNVLNSVVLNYAINNGDTISHQLSQLNVLPNGQQKYSFNHPISWTSGTVGSLNQVRFWTSLPNGKLDSLDENNQFRTQILRNQNNSTIERNVMFELATGAWCGFCPDGHLLLKQAIEKYGKRVVPISYHEDDSMSIPDGNVILRRYVSSYPDAFLDRASFLGSKSTWLNDLESRLSVRSPIEIKLVNKDFNSNTRRLTYTVKVKFVDYYYGKLRLGGIITEDNVRGVESNNLWSQSNYYSSMHVSGGSAGPTHPFYNELEFMHGYKHRFVLKEMLGGPTGFAGIIPQLVQPNTEIEYTFETIIPPVKKVSYQTENNTPFCSTIDDVGMNEGFNVPARLNLIAYVMDEDSNDIFNSPILNTFQEKLWDLESNISDIQLNNNVYLYPNPAGNTLNIKSSDGETILGIKIKSMLGNNILTYDNNSQALNIESLSNGVYFIEYNYKGQLYQMKFLVNTAY